MTDAPQAIRYRDTEPDSTNADPELCSWTHDVIPAFTSTRAQRPPLLHWVGNQSHFERIILQLAYSKKELTYLENKALFSLGVLESEDYLNDNIEGRYFKRDFGL